MKQCINIILDILFRFKIVVLVLVEPVFVIIFRIYRDVRFSKNKLPYKNNMGASISAGGKKSTGPGYYVHLQPGQSFLAGGIWMPESDSLKKIRQEIDYNGKQLKKVLNDKTFKKYYKEISQENKLKTVPKGYSKDHPDIE